MADEPADAGPCHTLSMTKMILRRCACPAARRAPMRRCAALLGLMLAPSAAWADDWTGPDKARHLLAGGFIAAAVTAATRDERTGFAAGSVAGLLKELHDAAGHGRASGKDFIMTVLGAYLGARLTGQAIAPDDRVYALNVSEGPATPPHQAVWGWSNGHDAATLHAPGRRFTLSVRWNFR